MTLADAQARAVESLGHEGELTTQDTILRLVERNELLVRLMCEYRAPWYYTTGKTGYECNFCRAMFEYTSHLHQHAGHAAGCPLPDALAVLLGTKE